MFKHEVESTSSVGSIKTGQPGAISTGQGPWTSTGVNSLPGEQRLAGESCHREPRSDISQLLWVHITSQMMLRWLPRQGTTDPVPVVLG